VSDSFVVTVAPGRDVMDRLADAIRAANTHSLVKAVLLAGHRLADGALDAGRTRIGCGLLQTLDIAVRELSGRGLSSTDAGTIRSLIAEARSTYRC
jgi:hypothetical protein